MLNNLFNKPKSYNKTSRDSKNINLLILKKETDVAKQSQLMIFKKAPENPPTEKTPPVNLKFRD